MNRMTTNTTAGHAPGHGSGHGAPTVPRSSVPYPADFWETDPVHPVHAPAPEGVHRAPASPSGHARIQNDGAVAPGNGATAPGNDAPGAPAVQPRPVHGAPAGAPKTRARLAALVHRARRRPAPVQEPERPAAPGQDDTSAPVQPGRTASVRTAAPKKKSRTAPGTETVRLGDQWGKLTEARGPWAIAGLRFIVFLIVVALIGVVVAPPVLSAHDIIQWAQSASVDSGLGLSKGWAWVAFIALDFAAGVCVLICVFAAIVNTKPGVFALYVWAFAGATAYANHSFGTRPGAPGDAAWFFPVMSVIGPLMLHSVLVFLRKRIKGSQGNKRGQRPSFPLGDWLPFTGTPQDTYGAWRTGAMLGIEVPDAALWAYRAVSLDANWGSRWFVKRLVRREQIKAFRARLEDQNLALAIPGLVPDGAFVDLSSAAEPPDQVAPTGAPAAPHRGSAPPGAPGVAPAVHGSTGAPAAPAGARPGQSGSTAAPGAPGSAPGAPAAPGAPGQGDPADTGAPGNVVNLADGVRHSVHSALVQIYEKYGAPYSGWDELIRKVALSRIEREINIGKRRAGKAFLHAETVLPWADAPAAVERERKGVVSA